MASKDPAERRQISQLGAFALHARHDPKITTQNSRAAFMRRFEDEVDPDRTLDPAERARRAKYARSLYFGRLALKSAQVRRRNRAER